MDSLAALPIVWHFVGRLQSNKTRVVAERFDWVHTVDRLKLAERLDEQRPPNAAPLNVLLQVNLAAEEQKAGVAPRDLATLARDVAALPRLKLRGLMTLPPRGDSPDEWFRQLAVLHRDLVAQGIDVDSLSMGMSADFEAAIAAGATLVRLGSAIFGERR